MAYDENWWQRDDHPDAKAHRRFVEKEGKAAAERTLAIMPTVLPPTRPRRQKSVLTSKDFENIGAAMGATVMPLIKKLEQRIEELEGRKAMSWRGTWRSGTSYAEGDCCQDKGSLWACKAPTSDARPGSGPGWQLMAKTTKAEDGK